MPESKSLLSKVKVTPDLIALTGLGLIINEAVFRHGPERPVLIGLFALMIGISPISRADDIRNSVMRKEPKE